MNETVDMLRREARAAAARAYVPYSGRGAAAVMLLADGLWVPGVRVESASFSLVIPALVNAFPAFPLQVGERLGRRQRQLSVDRLRHRAVVRDIADCLLLARRQFKGESSPDPGVDFGAGGHGRRGTGRGALAAAKRQRKLQQKQLLKNLKNCI